MLSRSLRSRWLVLFGVLGTSGLVAHCGAADSRSPSPPFGSGGTLADADRDTAESAPDVPVVPDGAGGTNYHPACGVVSELSCVPDLPLACAAYGPSQGGAASGGVGGQASAGAGGEAMGGAGGESLAGAGGAASSSGGAGGAGGAAAGAAGEGGMPPVSSGGTPGSGEGGASGAGGSGGASVSMPEYACQVVLTSDGPLAECLLAGDRLVGETCFSTSDCAPGLACVLDPELGICRPFCCAGDSSCTQGNYCDERQLADDSGSVLEVPVCVPANDCSLSEPYPCDGGSCTCEEGKACLVVRADGTTTCAEPGLGEIGDPCPCAWGHVCSASNQCVRLCETSRAEHYCGNSKCQASAELPEGWGVCVGPDPDASAR